MRYHIITIVLPEETFLALDKICSRYGQTQSDTIDQAVRSLPIKEVEKIARLESDRLIKFASADKIEIGFDAMRVLLEVSERTGIAFYAYTNEI